MRFEDPLWLHSIWLGLAVLVLGAMLIGRQRRTLSRWASGEGLAAMLGQVRWSVRLLRVVVLAVAVVLLGVSIARPQWGRIDETAQRKGREVVFIVDVSRSMLAQDLAPNRLEKAKLWITDLVETIDGDRVGLIAFAGAPVVKCPLTLDRGFLRLALEELGPESAPRGGTLIGDAIRKAIDQVFEIDDAENATPAFRDIVLITDGEDQESFPVEAARAAGELGIRIIAIGIGSDQGSLVPDSDNPGGFVRYQGERVRSRLDTGTLEQIAAAAPENVFFNVGTGTIDLARIYEDLIASAQQGVTAEVTQERYRERFAWFLIPAVVLVLIEPMLSDRRKARA